jgi:hypothetical protein
MVDMVVHRHKMREHLGRVLKLLTRKPQRAMSVRPAHEIGPYAVPMLHTAPSQPKV